MDWTAWLECAPACPSPVMGSLPTFRARLPSPPSASRWPALLWPSSGTTPIPHCSLWAMLVPYVASPPPFRDVGLVRDARLAALLAGQHVDGDGRDCSRAYIGVCPPPHPFSWGLRPQPPHGTKG